MLHLKKAFNRKKTAEKPWLTKEPREKIKKKHRVLNIKKRNPSEQAHTIFKYQRNLVIRLLKTAQNNVCKHFFSELPTIKEQWSFIK